VPPGGQLVRTARDTGISFGAPDEDSFHHAFKQCNAPIAIECNG
jgi:hypothetical protein